MTEGSRRGVTRGYVWGLIFATVIVAVALVIATWGLLALATDSQPVTTPGISFVVVPLVVGAALALLVWGLWSQCLTLLRGLRTPPWAHTIGLAAAAFLVWSVGGTLAGLEVTDTWLSPYALGLGLIWGVVSLLCWAVLARRVYTDKPPPQWPWERRGEPGPDWRGDDPWGGRERD